jgi:electron transfer flavoprotein alpha/beta subunit
MRSVALLRRPEDLVAARLAVRLGDATALAVAPEGDDIKKLLAGSGARRAIRLWDEALEGVDYLGVALALAGAIRALGGTDVVVCGDSGSGAVGPALAERLGWPHLGRVLDAWEESGKLFARRRGATGLRKLAAAPPAVLCLAPDPSLTLSDGELAVDSWTLTDAALTAAELSYRRSFRPRPGQGPKGEPRRFASVASLVERLRADGMVPEVEGKADGEG